MHVGVKYECPRKYVSGALFTAIYDAAFRPGVAYAVKDTLLQFEIVLGKQLAKRAHTRGKPSLSADNALFVIISIVEIR